MKRIKLGIFSLLCVLHVPALADVHLLVGEEPSEVTAFPPATLKLIQTLVDQAEHEVRQSLPALEEDIYLELTTGTEVIDSTGELGIALDTNRMRWVVNPASGPVADIAKSHLRRTFFHEAHHLVRGWARYAVDEPITIMDAAVAEGLASAYQRDFGNSGVGWSNFPKEIDEWVAEVLALENARDYHQWMFQHNDGRRLIGYRVGLYVVDKAIKASGKNAAQLVNIPTETILAMAGITQIEPEEKEASEED